MVVVVLLHCGGEKRASGLPATGSSPLGKCNRGAMPSRWEEERYTDGVKWKFLEHKGPVFAPPYEPLPSHVKFYYDGWFIYNAF